MPDDLIAGLTLAAIAIPEQMATARLGGFAPQIGFFAFIADAGRSMHPDQTLIGRNERSFADRTDAALPI